MKPLKGILDKEFKYRTAAQTDIRLTFARIRKQMKEQQQSNVKQFRKAP